MPDREPPAHWNLDALVGPFLTTDGVSRRLGISAEDVTALAEKGALLCVVTTDEVPLIPAYQLDDGRPITGLAETLAQFAGLEDPWMIATWFVSPSVDLDDRSPLDALRAGDRDAVARASADTAAAWNA